MENNTTDTLVSGTKIIDNWKPVVDNMCISCNKFRNGCRGSYSGNLYTGCIFKK